MATGPAVTDFFTAGRSPANVPAAMDAQGDEVVSFQTAAGIVAYASINDATIYDVTKAFWENLNQIPADHLAHGLHDLAFATSRRGTITFHPGAERYYREIGALVD